MKDADAVKNVAHILGLHAAEPLLVVLSAMGKTTNALEAVAQAYVMQQENTYALLEEVKSYHLAIIDHLFAARTHPVYDAVNNYFVEIDWMLEDEQIKEYNFVYDQMVSFGEFLSTAIVSHYLNESGVANTWHDVRDSIKTDEQYRGAGVQWETTTALIRKNILPLFAAGTRCVVTQGFVGSTSDNNTTTLGREGSDYTAAVFAHALDASEVVIWKDVPGVLNADPKFFKDVVLLDKISYLDTIELAYYGASVIHPKTVKPLENKKIPLRVKSFVNPTHEGSLISDADSTEPLVPSFIFKSDQILLSVSAMDFSFIIEEHLSKMFTIFARHQIKINLMQNSAISFSVCIDNDKFRFLPLLENLQHEFKVLYNTGLELHTVRHYTQAIIDKLSEGKEIILEQRSRATAQLVMRPR